MFVILKRIIGIGWKGFWRNGLLSSASILTLTITLVTAVFMYFGFLLSQNVLDRLESKVDINIYFTSDADESKVLEFRNKIYDLDWVDKTKTTFYTKDQALERFKQDDADKKMLEDVLDILKENPVGPVMNIKAKGLENYKKIVAFLESDIIQAKYLPIIDSTNYNQNEIVIQKIMIWTKYLKTIGIVGVAILLFISIILVYNTIRLIIYSYKEEIQVMRLIGASNFYARGPFLVEGILYGIISAILSLILVYTILYFTVDFFKEIFVLDLKEYFKAHLLEISAYVLLGGIAISFISTYLSVSRYLDVEN